MRDVTQNTSILGLNTATLGHMVDGAGAGWTTEQVIDLCAELELGSITFWARELENRAHSIGQHARSSGLFVNSLCRSPFLVGPLAPHSKIAVQEDFKRVIDLAAEVGAESVVVCVGGVIPDSHDIRYSLSIVQEIVASAAEVATGAGVRLALEPLHPVYAGDRSCLVTTRDAVDMILDIAHSALGIAIDVYHVWWDLTLEAELQRLDQSQILGLHLCDWLPETKDVLLDRGMMGDGVANIKEIRGAVERAGYTGYCDVEIFSAEHWWKLDPRTVLTTCIERFQQVC